MLGFKTFRWADIQFDDFDTEEGEVRYYVTPDGKFPSMTSVLGVLDDGGLDEWRNRVGEEEANRISEEAIRRGNSLHDLCELYLNNKLTRDLLVGKGKVLFNRAKGELDKIDLVLGTEIALYNKRLKYAGRADGLVVLDDKLTILDHKNSRRPLNLELDFCRKKLFKYMVQTCGYGMALREQYGQQATHGCLLVTNPKTLTTQKYNYPLDELEDEVKIITSAYHNKLSVTNSMYFSL